ncbi:DNA translocase FtsK [Bacillus gaemokensis]|uniref:Cell division protein FtsK n=1 Tax=Bacillus gaemokensis TaxID=574375 RepID=A0A073KD56_9BACI|nr:DNA translocase FtsK [Bacillus gaemokensis]KEK24495.1 cell division protein FtsK [Bacillus gaemokensis]
MLDWMKKLFNKEEHSEEKTAINKEVPNNTESQSKKPRVNHYTEAREAQMASRNSSAKCRFPLIPDDGLEEEDVEESPYFEQQPPQRTMNMERRRHRYVEEKPVHKFVEPEFELEPEPVVKKTSVPVKESNRRPFRPTETISPIFGYNRPSVEKKKVEEEKKEREDLEISIEGKSVVDAWLEKKGYSLSDFSEESKLPSNDQEEASKYDQQGRKQEEKSVVDQWLEKNGYETECTIPSFKEQEKVQEVIEPADSLLHKPALQEEGKEEHTIEAVQVFEQVQEVVALSKQDNEANEEVLQEELRASIVENMDKTLTEETECKKEIEEQLVEETILEENVAEVVEEQAEEELVTETEEAFEEELVAETEEVFEEELVAETEEAFEEELVEETEEATEEAFKEELVAETEEVSEEELVIEAEELSEQETMDLKAENEERVLTSEASEQTKEDVQNFANVLIEETGKKQEVAVEKPAEKKEEPKREKKRHVPFNVVMLKQDRRKLMERHAARVNNMTQAPTQQVEESPRVNEKPMQQVVVESQAEEKPMQEVVEAQAEERPVHQEVVKAQAEERPVHQEVVEAQAEERPVHQEVVKAQVEERSVHQEVVEAQAEERPVHQEVVKAQVEERSVHQEVVEAQVEERPVHQEVVEAQAEERTVYQEVVKPKLEEQPMQQVIVETQLEKQPVQQVEETTPVVTAEVQEKAYVVARRENDMRNVLQTPPEYAMPPLTLLTIPSQSSFDNTEWLEEQKELLDTTFNNFHVGAHVINVSQGPAVTRFEVQPDPGVKVNKITNLSDDIKLSLAARDIRIEAPIPGKSAIGIEVPNKESKAVFLREILRSPVFTKSESPLTVALGLDISGEPIVTDLRKMPHGLIAGATGSGKSVCINAILTSILYKAKPHEVKLMLIDPKMVELAPYNSIPHLVAPVITDVKAATAALKWAVEEMERRYESFAHAGARDLTRYNAIMSEQEIPGETLPYIVIVIDELADLMMVAPGDVEEAICRIAQKARACGIHLVVATQRPSVDVITGLIKSNIPTRIAFTVSSQVDSRTIIDIGGAEKLLGRGDMLFLGNGTSKAVRVQGVYVSDDEIEKSVAHVKKQMKPHYLFKQEDLLAKTEQHEAEDELFFDACQFVVEQGGASTSSVQRKFRIGYNRAARLIEEMEAQGIISEARGTKPRDVLISEDEFAAMQETNV